MARASTLTLLPLDTYAKTMLLNPAHFNGATAPNARVDVGGMMPLKDACSRVWWQYSWQAEDAAARETIAEQIAIAEEEIAQQLNYWPAPRWFTAEHHMFANVFDTNWQRATLRTNYGKVLAGGRRAVVLVGTATVADLTLVYSDTNLYEFSNRATITLPTDLTDIQEIKLYFAGHSGDPTYEIRPVRRKYLSGGNVVFEVDAWMLINPELWEDLPDGDGLPAIDISEDTNYVTSVEVYREYADPAQAAVEFYWRDPCNLCGGNGCSACATSMQTGCLAVVEPNSGMVVPYPADYDLETETWNQVAWSEARPPDYVKLYYRAGDRAEQYLSGHIHEPMRLPMIKAISYMATARLEGGLCACARVSNLVDWLQEDVSRLTQGASFFTPQELLLNPFGPRRGEVMAYRTVRAPKVRETRAIAI